MINRVKVDKGQRDVLRLLGAGLRAREVAQRLRIRAVDVGRIEATLCAAFGVTSRRALLAAAGNAGIVRRPGKGFALNTRQKVALRMLARGKSVAEIAAELQTKVTNVYPVLRDLRTRFSAPTNPDLLDAVMASGVLTLPRRVVIANPLPPGDAHIVADLLKELTLKEIGERIGKPGNAGERIRSICALLRVRDAAELPETAVRLGVITPQGKRPDRIELKRWRTRGSTTLPTRISERGLLVLRTCAQHQAWTMVQVGKALGIGEARVSQHLYELRRIFGVRSRTDLYDAARNAGLLAPAAPERVARDSALLKLLAEGRSERGIANLLHASPAAITKQIRHLMARHGARNRAELLTRIGRPPSAQLPAAWKNILKCRARELNAVQIAERLDMKATTIRQILFKLRRRYGVQTDAALVDAAIESGHLRMRRVETIRNPFTDRELGILKCLILGTTCDEIARERCTSLRTVVGCVMEMRGKVRVRTMAELLNEARRLGLIRKDGSAPARVPRSVLTRMNRVKSAEELTPRLCEFVRRLAKKPEATLKEIARDMGIGVGMAGVYMRDARLYLGADNRDGVIARAQELKIV